MASVEQEDKNGIVQRLREQNVRNVPEPYRHSIPYPGVQMHRPDKSGAGKIASHACHGIADGLQPLGRQFAPVYGDEYKRPFLSDGFCNIGWKIRRHCAHLFTHKMQGVDHGISGDKNTAFLDAFRVQILCCTCCRGKVQRRGKPRNPAVELFGKGLAEIVASQASLDMTDRDISIKSTGGRNHNCRCITLN